MKDSKDLYINAFEKVQMQEGRKDEIRDMIKEASLNKKPYVAKKATLCLAAASIIIAATFAIPPTREMTFAAARYLKSMFATKNGLVVEYDTTDEDSQSAMKSVSITTQNGDSPNYTSVKDGKLMFTVDGKDTDITDKCNDSDFYKYEYDLANNGHSEIYVGGTPENHGWVEFTFDNDGKITSQTISGNVKGTAWYDKALTESGADKAVIPIIIELESE